MLMQTYIRKSLGMKAHWVVEIREEATELVAVVEPIRSPVEG